MESEAELCKPSGAVESEAELCKPSGAVQSEAELCNSCTKCVTAVPSVLQLSECVK